MRVEILWYLSMQIKSPCNLGKHVLTYTTLTCEYCEGFRGSESVWTETVIAVTLEKTQRNILFLFLKKMFSLWKNNFLTNIANSAAPLSALNPLQKSRDIATRVQQTLSEFDKACSSSKLRWLFAL